ncbi:alpha-1,3-mannosyl-glycoprotein 2-beta-N-acetylglucosaminyltransferase [Pieris rapae]|uniref:alpha-1,3-mannosyl-glycoprotein 2-beta-N-acetylglucosaminyltransferase n=1 Tax=Pieris rapae TaxID=64459 RepID=UPI001E280614|nr:alpha-1,3-mannosyl-glycoprotein 2-beta-N-acetylglucosaminyltransferase [Pieris rapae]
MRVNLRKFLIIGICVICAWLLFTYTSIIRSYFSVPKDSSKKSLVELETRLKKLQEQLDNDMSWGNKLLNKMKHHLKKQTEKQFVVEQDSSLDIKSLNPILPVLVIACDRITVKRCLDNLVKFRPDKETFPIIVSQDCGHNATYQMIRSYTDSDPSISVVQQPDLSEIPLTRAKAKFKGYFKIARHYRFALNYIFRHLGHEAVIIVEDDLDISPDFFEYFLGTYPLLLRDPSIWCISAWNDNGKKELIDINRPELLHRTDFFPGLGWILRSETWDQLESKWPEAFFDDWLRDPQNTEGRSCIRPEVSRTYSFGKVGVSKGLFFDLHLRYMQLNAEFVEFTKLNLTYLIKDVYDDNLTSLVAALPESSAEDVIMGYGTGPVRVEYSNAKSYQRAAKKLGLMDDFRSGIPRTAYRGIVTCFIKGRRVYLAPSYEWTKYDPNWG